MNSRPELGGVCPLDDWGVIRAQGADAATFLQGQLTNDVLRLDNEGARLAGFCSAKGRLQASFIVWRAHAEEFFLACSADLLTPTLKRLSMFVLRAKCRLVDASAEVTLWGVAGATAAAHLGDTAVWRRRDEGDIRVTRLPDGADYQRAVVAVPASDRTFAASAPRLDADAWRWLAVQSGIVTIEAATVDRFVPQMVNFERVGGVDFKKGCYPGQEVVARSEYRGTTKRRTFLFDCDAVPSAGQDVFATGAPQEPMGVVANGAPRPGGCGGSALVELRLAAFQQGELRLGTIDGPRLDRRELPYPLLLETESTV